MERLQVKGIKYSCSPILGTHYYDFWKKREIVKEHQALWFYLGAFTVLSEPYQKCFKQELRNIILSNV